MSPGEWTTAILFVAVGAGGVVVGWLLRAIRTIRLVGRLLDAPKWDSYGHEAKMAYLDVLAEINADQ